MASRDEISMNLNILIKRDGSLWVGHCLELDIVATADTMDALKADILDLVSAQVRFAFSNDNLDHLYRPAPSEVWADFYRCKTQTEDRVSVKPARQRKDSRKAFVPPWIMARTCLLENSYA